MSASPDSKTALRNVRQLLQKRDSQTQEDFWHGWPDDKIPRYMEVTTRKVYNLRRRAFKTIRNFMMRKSQRHELSYDLICKAANGCPEALKEVLLYYDNYISALSAYEIKDEDGGVRRKIDPDMKAEIQCKLIEAIKKWRELI